MSATLHADCSYVLEFYLKLRWEAEFDCTRAHSFFVMQSAAAHSAVHARPAAFPHRAQGLGSLARSSLSNHDEAQQVVVRKPQLGEAISTVISRKNVVPPRCPRCTAHPFLALANADAPNCCLFSSPLHRLKPTLTLLR